MTSDSHLPLLFLFGPSQVDKATMVALDRLGMYVKIESKYGNSKLRLPFPRPVADRKDMKEVLVEMTRASASAAADAKA